MVTYQINVYGLVQGVGFRYFTFREANKLNIKGMAKNLDDGTVLVIAQGNDLKVQQLIKWLSHGPTSAKVEKIIVNQIDNTKLYSDFNCY